MALTISIEGTGIIANADAITDTAGGTWFELGGGTVSLSNDVFLIGGASIGGKYASKSGILGIDKGATTYDFSSGGANEGELIYIWVSATAIGTLDTLSTGPLAIHLSSGSSTTSDSNYLRYVIAGNDDANGWTGGWKCFIIDPTKIPTNINGTQATIIQSIQSIGIWIDCSTSARADSFFIGGVGIGNGLRITGTSTTGWKDVVDYCTDYATRGWGMFQEREGIYYSYGKTYIGDVGTPQASAVSFSDSGRTIQFGTSEYYNTSSAWVSSMPVDSSGIIIEDDSTATTGVTTFSDGVLVGTEQGRSGSTIIGNSLMDISLDLYGGNNTSSVTTLYGTVIKQCTGLINSGNDAQHKFLSCSFTKCSQFDPVGAPLIRNCTFAETSDIDASLLWNANINIENCAFIANTIGAAYEYPTQGSYSQVELKYDGNTYDILYSDNASSGLLTINATDSNPSTYEITNTTGNTVSIINTVILEINGVKTGNEPTNYVRCYIEKTSDNTVLMSEEAQTSYGSNGFYKTTESYNYTTDTEVRVRARYKGYLPFETIGTIASGGLTITAIWQEDPNYI